MAGAGSYSLNLEGRRSFLESSLIHKLIDSFSHCTATTESTCQLVEHLSSLNEVLFWAKIELRETPETCGQLSLTSFVDKRIRIQSDAQKTRQAIFLFLWLIKAHACIDHVKIDYDGLYEYQQQVFDVLKCRRLGKPIRVHFRASVLNKNVDDALCSMEHLEVLHFLAMSSCDKLQFSLPNVIRTRLSMTTLRIGALCLRGSRAKCLVAALKENSTLKELSINGSVICEAGLGVFAEYLKTNTSLTTLCVTADYNTKTSCFNWIAEGLLLNKAIENLTLTNVHFDRVNAQLAAHLFSENKTMRTFNAVDCAQDISLQPGTAYNLWQSPLSNNNTLEELTLPFSIWKPEQWADFFWIAARKASLKKIIVFVPYSAHYHLPALCKVLKESGAEEKVSLGTYLVRHNMDLIYSKAFSIVEVLCHGSQLTQIIRLLPPFTHITSIGLRIKMGNLPLASSVASYIKATTSLQKLLLTLYWDEGDTEENVKTSWTEIVGALSFNRSVKNLEVCVDSYSDDHCDESTFITELYRHQIKRLAEVIRHSSTIRRMNFDSRHSLKVATFLRSFSENVTDNYVLVGIDFSGTLNRESTQDCFKVWDTVRRNCGIVAHAAQFIRGKKLRRHSAGALEQVWRHAGLHEELAEQQSISVAEVTSIVRRGLLSIEGLHDFMRLAGVVQDSVVCEPRQHDRPQLDTLNEDCWRLVRRYLVLDDVRQPSNHHSCTARPYILPFKKTAP